MEHTDTDIIENVEDMDMSSSSMSEFILDIENAPDLNQNCIICFGKINMVLDEYVRLSECSHSNEVIYHYNCIRDWFSYKKTCPMCRKRQHRSNIIWINKDPRRIRRGKKRQGEKSKCNIL